MLTISKLFEEAKKNGAYLAVSHLRSDLQESTVIQKIDGTIFFQTHHPVTSCPTFFSWDFLKKLHQVFVNSTEDDSVTTIRFYYPGHIPFSPSVHPVHYDVARDNGFVTITRLPTAEEYFFMLDSSMYGTTRFIVLSYIGILPPSLHLDAVFTYGCTCSICGNGTHAPGLCLRCATTCVTCWKADMTQLRCVGCRRACHKSCAERFLCDLDNDLFVCEYCAHDFIWCDKCTQLCSSEGSFRCTNCDLTFCAKTNSYLEYCESCYLENNCSQCVQCEESCDERKENYWTCANCFETWHFLCTAPSRAKKDETLCKICHDQQCNIYSERKQQIAYIGLTWHKILCRRFKLGDETLEEVRRKFAFKKQLEKDGLEWTNITERIWTEHSDYDAFLTAYRNVLQFQKTLQHVGLADDVLAYTHVDAEDIPCIVQKLCEHKLIYEYVDWSMVQNSGSLRDEQFLDKLGARMTRPWLEGVSKSQWREKYQPSLDPKRRKTVTLHTH